MARWGKVNLRIFTGRVNHLLGRPRGGRYFHIELSSRYRWYIGPVRLMLVAISGVLVVSIAWDMIHTVLTVRDQYNLQEGIDRIRAQHRQLLAEAQKEGLDLSGAIVQQLPGEVLLANQLLTKRNFSWTQFLSGLEAAIPRHISIKSIRVDPESTVVHMVGLAVTVEDVTALTVSLQDHPVFRDPVLGQHRAGSDGLVEFDLTLRYRQPGI